MASGEVKKTRLYSQLVKAGGDMIEFAGYLLPVRFSGIIPEHLAVRSTAGIFDLSHMGEFFFEGADSARFLHHLLANDILDLEKNHICYTPMLYPDGGIVDDLLCYCLEKNRFMLVVNASNIAKDEEWVREQIKKFNGDVIFNNRSDEYTLIAIQGPRSQEILSKITDIDLTKIKYYMWDAGIVAGQEVLLSRTGYTGEDGFEIYVDLTSDPVKIWDGLWQAGKNYGLIPIGLGARDTLRLEKKMCLYGNDIDRTTNPLEAGIGWTVKLDKDDFIGKSALVKIKADGLKRKLVGFKMLDKAIPRHDYLIFADGKPVGTVTSGTFSPSLSIPVGLGYVETAHSSIDTRLEIEIREQLHPAVVVKAPFL
jgi:aminomethyltransferase